uniref:Uncharacterized protein n=1 Tax=Periophthalmus magnuspinnatus TaxID=409849 RepID=A0A3B3ZC99_9GOBI
MSVTVKAYLLGKEDTVKEIRRFTVDHDVSASFEYLSRKVTAAFSHLCCPWASQMRGANAKANANCSGHTRPRPLSLNPTSSYICVICVEK